MPLLRPDPTFDPSPRMAMQSPAEKLSIQNGASMVQPAASPITILPGVGESVDFGGRRVEWKIAGSLSDGRFAFVHHPPAPHALAAPLHYHHNEDELSYVLRGTLGALLGDDWSGQNLAHACRSPGINGTRSGMTVTLRAKSSRSFHRRDLRSTFARSPLPGVTWPDSVKSIASTRSICASTAYRICAAGSA